MAGKPLQNNRSEAKSPDFRRSHEQAFRRLVRDAVRRGPFTKSERDVTLALVNLWLHHKGGPKPYVHPGRESLARKAGCTIKTVSRTLAKLRAAGIADVISNPRGGRDAATRYRLDVVALLAFCGCDWLDDFTRARGFHAARNVPQSKPEMSHKEAKDCGTKCPTVLRDRASCTEEPIQEGEAFGGVR